MKKTAMLIAIMTGLALSASAVVIDAWDMNVNGTWQSPSYSETGAGVNLGGHYKNDLTVQQYAQTDDDGVFLFAPIAASGYAGKSALSSSIDLTAGLVTLSMAFTDVDWSGTPLANNNIGFRLYESAAVDAEYVGINIFDNGDRIRARSDNSTAMGGQDTVGRYGADLTASGTYNAVIEVDYANDEIRFTGGWDWNPAGEDVVTTTVDFAAAGFSTIGNFQTRYANWSTGDTITMDDITVSQVPEPATFGMLGLGAIVIFTARRLNRRSR